MFVVLLVVRRKVVSSGEGDRKEKNLQEWKRKKKS